MKISLLQMTSTDVPAQNLETVLQAIDDSKGADLLVTPEVTNCVSVSRKHQRHVLNEEANDLFLKSISSKSHEVGLNVALGSIALKSNFSDQRFVNRSFLVGSCGKILAAYNKIHMFDVSLPNGETYRESDGYKPGNEAVVAKTPWCKIGLTVCYDLRFPHLFRALAKAGAKIILVPAAFAVPTGKAHWHILLRARAIETGCYIIAAAQTGTHETSGRKTYGHSLVVSPWGEVLLDAGKETGLHKIDLDLSAVDTARSAVPSLYHDQSFKPPVFE